MWSAKRAKPGFSLGDFARMCEILLVEERCVYCWESGPEGASWQRICTLSTMESCDAAALTREAASDGAGAKEAELARAAWRLRRYLPDTVRGLAAAVVELVLQAERFRRGESTRDRNLSIENRLSGDCLEAAIGSTETLVFDGRVHNTPLIRLSRAALSDVSVRELRHLPFHERSLTAVRNDYWRLLRAELEEPPDPPEQFDSAVQLIAETAQANTDFLGMTELYNCPETGFRVLARRPAGIVLALASDAFVVEDADGRLYRFGAFVVSLEIDWETRLCSPPVLLHPIYYIHWLTEFRPRRPLHLCDFLGELGGQALDISNAVELLLGARRIIRSSLFGGTVYGDTPQLSGRKFASLRISRENVEKLGLPVYPFFRHDETNPDTLRRTGPLVLEVEAVRRERRAPRRRQ